MPVWIQRGKDFKPYPEKTHTPVLLLCSYCGDDDPDCTNEVPCEECLKMCNIALVPVATPFTVLGGWDYLTGIKKGGG